MVKFLWLLIASCTLTSCDKETNDSVFVNPSPKLCYLALGDSYTIGESVSASERFPYLTTKILSQSGLLFAEPEYIAITGWTTNNLITAINERNPKAPYDIVTLLIGVNDQYQRLDTAGYRLRFTQLLNKAIELTGNRKNRVFVLSIPDYSATPFVSTNDKERVSKEIDGFNNINSQVSLSKITQIGQKTKLLNEKPQRSLNIS
ncbi:MAG: SGNH/GDSL hydrolase family protein [Flavobacterium sp.]|nr:MAG: SGNH/GDSL hydrolase family protein [Flavobacterium sp.]